MTSVIQSDLKVHDIPAVQADDLKPIFLTLKDNVEGYIDHNILTGDRSISREQYFQYILGITDYDEYRRVQLKHLNGSYSGIRRNELKYLNSAKWLYAKYVLARRIGLHQSSTKNVLDIGCGPGHFQLACQYFGHITTGIDMRLQPRDGVSTHLYDDLYALWGLDRHTYSVRSSQLLPALGAKFDLVTAFMICFSSTRGEPWTPDDWRIFLGDLRDNQLTKNGTFWGTATRGSMSDESWRYLKARSSQSNDNNLLFVIDNFAFLDRERESFSVRNPNSALLSGDIEGAMAWYRAHQQQISEDDSPHLEMAARTGRTSQLDPFVEIIEASVSKMPTSAFMVGQAVKDSLESGASLQQSIGGLGAELSNKFGDSLNRAYGACSPTRSLQASRHIALCGISYCGSTLLERIFGGIEGAESIGESIYLTQHHGKDGNKPIKIEKLDYSTANKCSKCGINCRYLTPEFRASLAFNPINWYQQIGDRLECSILISSDKNLPKIIRNDPLLRLDAVVTFKSPIQSWWSYFSKLEEKHRIVEVSDELVKFSQMWIDRYSKLLFDFCPKGKKVFLDFDYFTAYPREYLYEIFERLNLEWSQDLIQRVRPSHSIGGNGNAVRKLKEADYVLDIECRSDELVPVAHREWLMAHSKMMRLHNALKVRACSSN